MPKGDLDSVLADLRRQRAAIDRRIAELQGGREGTVEIIDRLQKLRERSANTNTIGPDDPTVRLRR